MIVVKNGNHGAVIQSYWVLMIDDPYCLINWPIMANFIMRDNKRRQ